MKKKDSLFLGNHLRVRKTQTGNCTLSVTFDYWKKDRKGFFSHIPAWKECRVGDATSIHVETAANDWFLNSDLPSCLQRLREYALQFSRRNLIGFSMGGFGCLLTAAAIRADRVVLVSPHLPPGHCLKTSALAACSAEEERARQSGWEGEFIIFFDSKIEKDRYDAAVISSSLQRCTAVALPFGGHPATKRLARQKGFPHFKQAVFLSEPDIGEILQLHRAAIDINGLKSLDLPPDRSAPLKEHRMIVPGNSSYQARCSAA